MGDDHEQDGWSGAVSSSSSPSPITISHQLSGEGVTRGGVEGVGGGEGDGGGEDGHGGGEGQ